MLTKLIINDTEFHLCRYPIQKNEKHQAWDAADEYLIQQTEQLALPISSHIVIFNDSFGALACYFASKGFKVSCVNDSLISQQSIEYNLVNNKIADQAAINLLSSIDELPADADLALMKLPKNNRLLVWQLSQLAALAKKEIRLIAAAKAKDIHTSTLSLFETHLGETKTSLARKKARLIFCEKNKSLSQLPQAITQFTVPEFDLTLSNYPNVFSAEKLDIAAFLMLKHIPSSENFNHIIDLGCGNGVLAIEAARKNPQAKITVIDESHMAVMSAKLNLLNHQIDKKRITCLVNNSLAGVSANSADLILCNPPFHQQHTVTDHIAWQMFCDAKRALSPKGLLVVIGNRHLGYHKKIGKLFNNTNTVASNAKFTVIRAIK